MKSLSFFRKERQMQLIGETVFHKKFGEGKILDKSDRILIICFPTGEKEFHFPDAFEKHLVLKNRKKQSQVDKVVSVFVSEREAHENARLEEQKRQDRIMRLKIRPNSQVAFGFIDNTKKEVFSSWVLSTGTYLSGNRKGTPRIPKKMRLNSACLLTECPGETEEKERKIIGACMVKDDFDGRICSDGIIHSHEKYKIKLEPSEQLFFWDYFSLADENNKWGNIEIRYFSSEVMQKILEDIQKKVTDPGRKKLLDEFYQYYLWVNKISEQEEMERIASEMEKQGIHEKEMFGINSEFYSEHFREIHFKAKLFQEKSSMRKEI